MDKLSLGAGEETFVFKRSYVLITKEEGSSIVLSTSGFCLFDSETVYVLAINVQGPFLNNPVYDQNFQMHQLFGAMAKLLLRGTVFQASYLYFFYKPFNKSTQIITQ